MFDIWFGKVELTEVIIYFSILVLIPIQLFLCFKANNKALKLLPIGILALLLVIFMYMIQLAPRWERIGVSRQAVSKWESGLSNPSTTSLIALAKLFDVTPEDLLKNVSQ